jgi:hypothetical protein
MKLLKENDELHADEFSNASPYVIMFGPDKCGSTNKVSFHLNAFASQSANLLLLGALHLQAQEPKDWLV